MQKKKRPIQEAESLNESISPLKVQNPSMDMKMEESMKKSSVNNKSVMHIIKQDSEIKEKSNQKIRKSKTSIQTPKLKKAEEPKMSDKIMHNQLKELSDSDSTESEPDLTLF